MGPFFSGLKREFVARPDQSKNQIVFKWPDATIPKFAQLTVEPDEVALFVREGKVAGTLAPGRSTLDAANIPFLGGLIDGATGGNFLKSELYFVSTREFPSLPFGGTIDNVVDPDTQLAVGLRVFGDYSLKVVDAGALIVNLVGSQNLVSNDQITDWMRDQVLKALRTDVTASIVNNNWAILGIAARTEQIEAETLAKAQTAVATYGVQIVRMGNFTISINEQDETTLKNFRRDIGYTKLAGSFTQYGAGAALRGIGEGAAKGDGGGSSALLGIGMGLGNMVAGAAAPPQAAAQPAQAAAPAAAAATVTCPSCGAAHAPGVKFCPECGAAQAAGPAHCTQCGTEAAPGAKFCGNCGASMAPNLSTQ
jgi:membrane protease subunit (stomatin/prohibitin family)